MTYHPQFFSPITSQSVRNCLDRFVLIKPFIEEGSTLLDLGCSEGWFSFSFSYICKQVLGIDMESELVNGNNTLRKEHGIKNIRFEQDNVSKLFKTPQSHSYDTILYMSTHHHVIQAHDNHKEILRNISQSGKQMFFDCGQKSEGCTDYGWWKKLPETDDCEQWVKNYLEENTVYKTVEKIGASLVHGVPRYLFRAYNGTNTDI